MSNSEQVKAAKSGPDLTNSYREQDLLLSEVSFSKLDRFKPSKHKKAHKIEKNFKKRCYLR